MCPSVRIVVVVNGCSDDTAQQALASGAEVIHSEPGYGKALLAGYRLASQAPDLPWLLQMDADGQHPAESIPVLLDALDAADLSIGSRFLAGGSAHGWPSSRRWTIAFMASVTRFLSGLHVRDVTSGFQAMRPGVVHHLAADFRTDLTDANVLVRLHRKGFKIEEVPVRMQSRDGGRSMHGGLKSLIYVGRTLIAVRSEMRG